MAARILVIEDHAETARLLVHVLSEEPAPFEVFTVPSARAGLAYLAEHPVDCVLLDYRLPDADGLKCLGRIRQSHADLPVIVITGAGSEEIAVEAMKAGATDYVVKQGKYLATVPVVVREALGRRELEREAARYRSALRSTRREVQRLRRELRDRYRLEGLLGESEAMEEALALAEHAATSRAPVLLEGEAGTGKKLLARAIHYHGPRARSAFVAVNCAALPETLLESELFGHLRGAFPGADRPRRGVIEEAAGGTVLLDEVGAASASTQTKLVRLLDVGEVRPLGGGTPRRIEVRVIATTSRDLREAASAGRFRRDLHQRLDVSPIRLPPLRERRGDVALLAKHFLDAFARGEGKRLRGFAPAALRLLERFPWPGNVRELESEMQRIVLAALDGERVTAEHLAPAIVEGAPPAARSGDRRLKEIVRDVELATIRARLREHGYHRSATARSLGVTREWLWAKMRRLGVVLPVRGSS